METKLRTIKISLEQAREWYNDTNPTLRKLALQAYSEKEINEPQSLKEISDSLGIKELSLQMRLSCKDSQDTMNLIKEIDSDLTLHMRLALIAKYFNGSLKPEIKGTKYFLAKSHQCAPLSYSKLDLGNGFYVGKHERVTYPGVVYFKDAESVKKAFKILKDKLY